MEIDFDIKQILKLEMSSIIYYYNVNLSNHTARVYSKQW